MVSVEDIINQMKKNPPRMKIRKNSIKFDGIPIDVLKDLKIGDIRRLDKEVKKMKGGKK